MMGVSRKAWAEAVRIAETICINSFSGYSGTALDLDGSQWILPETAPFEVIGRSVVDCLNHSRVIEETEISSFFNSQQIASNYERWVATLMAHTRLSRSRLFGDMKLCWIRQMNNEIIIQPSNHEKLEAWSRNGISENQKRVLKDAIKFESIGEALLDCFEKCI